MEKRLTRIVRPRLAALTAGTLIAVAAAESILRLAGIGYGNAPLVSDPILHHRHPANYRFRIHHPSGEYGGHEVVFGADGYRAGQEPPAAAARRLALVGDSFIEGLQLAAPQTVTGLLQNAFGPSTQVKNFGVASYSPVLFRLQWEADIRRFGPTDVFVLLYSNDPVDDAVYAAGAQRQDGRITAVPGPGNDWAKRLLRRSYLVRLLRLTALRAAYQLKRSRDPAHGVTGLYLEQAPEIGEVTEHALLELRSEVEKTGARFWLSAVPSKYLLLNPQERSVKTEFADRVKTWASGHGVAYADLVPAFRRAAEEEPQYFTQDIHWNAAGHRTAARVLAQMFSAGPASP